MAANSSQHVDWSSDDVNHLGSGRCGRPGVVALLECVLQTVPPVHTAFAQTTRLNRGLRSHLLNTQENN